MSIALSEDGNNAVTEKSYTINIFGFGLITLCVTEYLKMLIFFLISTRSYQGIKLVEFVDGVCWGWIGDVHLEKQPFHLVLSSWNYTLTTLITKSTKHV
ncbi:hypothetical protein LAZ67_23000299 [Cordylochernes scorpioides]|uniref:Uncharacterized protein n=1 Tax=Cordylochernes scorpioides TaxID=51811 RepID=A0ABY6LPZ1_9ARAC|nr:hypothetical protein LAZ67_23000299 [Cordylochernes scorpioides]